LTSLLIHAFGLFGLYSVLFLVVVAFFQERELIYEVRIVFFELFDGLAGLFEKTAVF
jgi:hypothetical protein